MIDDTPKETKHEVWTLAKEFEKRNKERAKEAKQQGIDDTLDDILRARIFDKTGAQKRKATPVTTGVLFYFPDAIREVAKTSQVGNDQHHPGTPLHWDKSKSVDEYDALVRHLLDHQENAYDSDGVLHLAKVAWRALAGLQRYLDGLPKE